MLSNHLKNQILGGLRYWEQLDPYFDWRWVTLRRKLNILVTGIGGQGLLTLASIIANAAVRNGYNTLVAETHGLSQRGGTVEVHVRIGEVEAPLISPKDVDIIISTELIETVRHLYYADTDTIVYTSTYLVPPPIPDIDIPTEEELISILKRSVDTNKLWIVDTRTLASKIGNIRTQNIILLGVALGSNAFRGIIDYDSVREAILTDLRKLAEENIKALKIGYIYARERLSERSQT